LALKTVAQNVARAPQGAEFRLKYEISTPYIEREFLLIGMGIENKKATHHLTGGLINGSFNYS